MGYWLELSSTIRQWADVIGLIVFIVGVGAISIVGICVWVRNKYYKEFMRRKGR